MATRLEIAHGLIAEPDRLSTSGDTLSVTRPDTGSRTRSKGVLFVVVSSDTSGPHGREASRLVSDTIRREYYYDESAGVPVCLEKAVRSADKRLRSSREVAGLAPGSLGVGVAVIRNNELYLATIGAVEAYLVRAARLLMPDRHILPGLPSGDSLRLDVWRGELSVGDALLLVSRAMTETVGTEELKSAVLTLHPQAAVEHLHHLFVAAGGQGSDAVMAVEAREQTTTVAARPPGARSGAIYGDRPDVTAQPIGVGAASTFLGARNPAGPWPGGLLERLWGVMPRRRPSVRDIRPHITQLENQRRAALGVLAFVAVVLVLGIIVVLLPRSAGTTPQQVSGGDSALAAARDRILRAANLAETDPVQALTFYREAWGEIQVARRTGLEAGAVDDLESRTRVGLDGLYGARVPEARALAEFADDSDPVSFTLGPDGAAYYLDRAAAVVVRVDPDGGTAEVVHRGDRPASGSGRMGVPTQIDAGGPDVVIVDDEARAWRWRPSDKTGRGTLARLTFLGDTKWGSDHGDVETFASPNGYRMYVVEPAQHQILRYQPTFDGSAFNVPSDYLVTESDEVEAFRQIHIDADLYALTGDGVQKYEFGRFQGGFTLEDPPDGADLRPGYDYRLMAGTGSDSTGGLLYLYDAKWDRIVVFDKTDGTYVRQWVPGEDGPPLADARGLEVVPGTRKRPDAIYWLTPGGTFTASLATKEAGASRPSTAPEEAQPKKKKKRRAATGS